MLTPPGLPLRPRLPLLGRLAPRHVLPPRNRLVDHPRPDLGRHHRQRPVPPRRGRLRAPLRRVRRAGRPVNTTKSIN
jgi:hypothetical protein